MKISKTQNGTSVELAIEGRLDTMTAPELEREVKSTMNGIKNLTLNLEKLEYISSAGLRVLLMAHKTMVTKGSMKIINVSEIVREVFDVTGFSDILNIE